MSRNPLSSRNSEQPPRRGAAGGTVKGRRKDKSHFSLDRVTLVSDLNKILEQNAAYGKLVLCEDDLKIPVVSYPGCRAVSVERYLQ